MPVFSVVIPAYNNSRYLPECVHSITSQSFRDLEVIIVDDASTDDTYVTMQQLAAEDERVILLRNDDNSGTLTTRQHGVTASHGDYVLLIDQDDELAPGALASLHAYAQEHPADIYHYGVRVDAATNAARDAAAGMTNFLTPMPRTLQGEQILATQFAQQDGFDWHVHHKMFRGTLARRAYTMAPHTRLLLSDDLYMCFVIDALADSYAAIPDSPWYVYHLGRGETLGSQLTLDAFSTLAARDAKALRLINAFVAAHSEDIHRSDWDARVADVRDRLIEHTMNEWQDNLPASDKPTGLDRALRCWPPDAVCGELYRYVRDYAYAYLVADDRGSDSSQRNREQALHYLRLAQDIEHRYAEPSSVRNDHYRALKAIAMQHLTDSGLVSRPANAPQPKTEPDTESASVPRHHSPITVLRSLFERIAYHRTSN
ncbi:glycosyltransferase family 2 protein [Bifidobacterium sp. 82T10]|uniref:Glycosyltransferase family 2 protein n=1 Tax=Bifidobacterium miconis TaxID=2834435 RepID=A0ABS6WGT4_9BIFI|nr:glycosyltransferase family A protein [Bifidobacterium miconis]MBW3093266.1 glycosyltransferase family 2 protein [Bifidobacterium miconis]